MALDKASAGPSQLALGLMGRILAADDFVLVHEQAGGNRQLVRQFHAERRRSFYGCLRVVYREALGRGAAAEVAGRGVVRWLEQVRLFAALGWLVIAAEIRLLRLRFGWDTPGIIAPSGADGRLKLSILP